MKKRTFEDLQKEYSSVSLREIVENMSPEASEAIAKFCKIAIDYTKSPLGRLNLALCRSPEEFEKEWNRIIEEAKAK
jgi:hypothetical protein